MNIQDGIVPFKELPLMSKYSMRVIFERDSRIGPERLEESSENNAMKLDSQEIEANHQRIYLFHLLFHLCL